MLNANLRATWRSGQLALIRAAGVQCAWRQVKAPNATATAVVGFKTAGKDDQEVINSYGIDTVIITCAAVDFASAPAKYDEFVINNETYIANAVHPIHEPSTADVIMYKVLARGR